MSVHSHLPLKTPRIHETRQSWEASQYHNPNDWGFFSILSGKTKKKQCSYQLHYLASVLEKLQCEDENYWISQARFKKPNRRIINLLSVGLLFLDLDYYKIPKYAGKSAEEMKEIFLAYCSQIGFPEPSIILDSGQGLQIKWYHENLPAKAFPIWSAAESWLVWAFVDLGADTKVTDVSRVLRVLDTINQKNGKRVCVLHTNWSMLNVTRLEHYAFKDDLCTAILPYSQEAYHERKKQQENTFQVRREKAQLELLETDGKGKKKGNTSNLRKFSPIRLAWGQVEDYIRLGEERLPEERPEGWTNELMWLSASALAMAVWGNVDRFYYELVSLGRQIAPHWDMARVHQSCSSVNVRCKEMAQGKWVEYNGKKYPPIYTPRHSTIIKKLKLTDEEIRKNQVIVPRSVKKERDAELKRKIRHEKGENKLTQKEYKENVQEKRKRAKELRNQGKTNDEIAQILEVHPKSIPRLIKALI